jgi:hypothetical protein
MALLHSKDELNYLPVPVIGRDDGLIPDDEWSLG